MAPFSQEVIVIDDDDKENEVMYSESAPCFTDSNAIYYNTRRSSRVGGLMPGMTRATRIQTRSSSSKSCEMHPPGPAHLSSPDPDRNFPPARTGKELAQSGWNFLLASGSSKPSNRPADIGRTPSPLSEFSAGCPSGPWSPEPCERPKSKKRVQVDLTSESNKRTRSARLDNENIIIIEDGDVRKAFLARGRKPTSQEVEDVFGGVIELHEDDSEDTYDLAATESTGVKRLARDGLIIDLDDIELEEDFYEIQSRLTTQRDRGSSQHRLSYHLNPRNSRVKEPWKTITSLDILDGQILKLDKVVELDSGDFLRIKKILRNTWTNEVKLRGHQLQRTRDLNGLLPKKLNEMCWRFDIDLDDKRDYLDQAVIEVHPRAIRNIRLLRSTNLLFPAGSYRDTLTFKNKIQVENEAPYTVRWKFTCTYLNAKYREENDPIERCFQHLLAEDISGIDQSTVATVNFQLRERYRGLTIRGGAHDAPADFIDLVHDENSEQLGHYMSKTTLDDRSDQAKSSATRQHDAGAIPSHRADRRHSHLRTDMQPDPLHAKRRPSSLPKPPVVIGCSNTGLVTPLQWGPVRTSPGPLSDTQLLSEKVRPLTQKYTYGDCFSGAGGATRGALMAGLKVKWGLDFNNHACTTWRMNFPNADMYEMSAENFIQTEKGGENLKVDILHISPPCQFFSPAHTIPGQDDEMNTATLFSCGDLIDLAKPRIITLEQTFGLTFPRFQHYLHALVQMFTCRGFSVRYKTVNLENWGLPQRRQRLIMIASCPGEALPEFPPLTHASPSDPRPGLQPWTTVNSVLNSIPRNAPNHNLREVKRCNAPPWSGDSIAPRCVTTSGGQNYHPSGKRHFTYREFAGIQGFPHNHRFHNVNTKKQIGNAVPPSIAKVLFRHIIRALEKADGVLSQGVDADYVILDDDEPNDAGPEFIDLDGDDSDDVMLLDDDPDCIIDLDGDEPEVVVLSDVDPDYMDVDDDELIVLD